MLRRIVLIVVLASLASGLASGAKALDGDPIAGKSIFQRICQNCHSAEIGINKVGPSLWNIVGRQPAAVPDYVYSEGMKTNKTPWTAAALDTYIADPRGDVHGVKMYFKGLADGKERADVVAYLSTLK
ncbi:c-type cytochrome [Bradyrhizobium ontarionense]|uniref:C-type cytochrome n=1 Tax=Bradyrhizobium ontarionense TaxID=2898149 RepID=A0ABY3RKU6_9BRAD|nr:c-type cytochrome [Bradyrhizobium sp. A19]UFZ07894.1 c-type cytochrome [Bradyrhizobium sp. A19]